MLVSVEKNQIHAVISGVLVSNNPKHSYAFIQFHDGQSHHATYHRYPLRKFFASPIKLEIGIESSFLFSTGRLAEHHKQII